MKKFSNDLWLLFLVIRSFVGDTIYTVIAIILMVLAIFYPVIHLAVGLRYSVLIIMIGILIIALSVLMIFIMSYVGLTKVEGESAQVILREGKPYLFVVEKENHILDVDHNVKKILGPGTTPTPEDMAKYQWPDRKVIGGERWYWKTIESIMEIKWDFISTKKTGLGVVERKDQVAINLYLGDYPYGVKIGDNEFVDITGVPLLLELKVPAKSVNPYKQWISNKNWFSRFHGLIASSLRDWVNTNDYNKIISHGKREIAAEIIKWLTGLRPTKDADGEITSWAQGQDTQGQPIKDVLLGIKNEIGVEVVASDIAVQVFIQSPQYQKLQTARYEAEREAERDTARAKGFGLTYQQAFLGHLATSLNKEVKDLTPQDVENEDNKEKVKEARMFAEEMAGRQQKIGAGTYQSFEATGFPVGGGLEAAVMLAAKLKLFGGGPGGSSESKNPKVIPVGDKDSTSNKQDNKVEDDDDLSRQADKLVADIQKRREAKRRGEKK